MAKGSDIQNQLLDVFFEECEEGLETVETGFLELDVDEPDSEQINLIFRALHSIKGSSGSFGFTAISEFAHHAETLLDEIRSGTRGIDADIVNLFLKSGDHIRAMVEAAREGSTVDAAETQTLTDAFKRILERAAGEGAESGSRSSVTNEEEAPAESLDRTWRIRFEPNASMLQTGNDPIRILRGLEDLGSLTVVAAAEAIPVLREIEPENAYLSFELELTTDGSEAEIRENFAWVEDECRLTIEPVGSAEALVEAPLDADASDGEDQAADAADASARAEGGEARRSKPRSGGENARANTSIRVSTDKVDALINMVGELVIIQSMLSDIGENPDPSKMGKLREGLAQLQNNTRELQERVMRIRMLPISFAFNRFPRLVHDLSEQLGKRVELKISGEGTELDKNVLEQIGDPLVHLVRNSLDHGLEPSDVRVAAGKSEVGTVRLNAYHRGGNILIEVSDDGRGIDAEKLRAKAIARGLIDPEEVMSDERIQQLVFEPGLSTAEKVSDVSGRGVGMDVVRRNVKALGGNIQVYSKPGEGTTFTVRLPLTLAILDGQLVRVGSEVFVIPLVSIIESLQIRAETSNTVAGKADVYRLRNEAVPILRLHDIFGMDCGGVDASLVGKLMVVVESGQTKAGLVVDELLGQQQVVIKSLETNFKSVAGFAGATILGDGTVALILDVPGVMDQAGKSRPRPRKSKTAEPQPAPAVG
ncbi:MAG: chemotaxis protein CheA [Myxococcota bacterium]|nr:chemotaxis protein CheA [Myxococcales bacterium]